MKPTFLIGSILLPFLLNAQSSEDLLVYSVKGMVTVVENNIESRLKIGKVLKASSIIRTQRESKLTMVCRQGKAISVLQEGEFPVITWRDSCKTNYHSVTANYFQYIWNQFYLRSPEGQDEIKKGSMSLAKDGAPLRAIDDITGIRIEFNSALDTINYTGGDFPLSWNTTGYEGKFLFQLFNSRDGKLIYKDSVSDNKVMISKFSKLMQPGKSYRWLIGTRGMSIRRPRVINCVQPIKLKEYIDNIDSLDVPEDPAAVYFRIGYMLEKERYYAQVLEYYIKAVMLDEETLLYIDKLTRFCKEFRVDMPDFDE